MKEIQFDNPLPPEEKRKNGEPKGSDTAPAVRTFRADVLSLIKEKSTTKTQLVEAEAARREARGENRMLEEGAQNSHLGRVILILSLVFIFALGVGVYGLLHTDPLPAERVGTNDKEPAPRPAKVLFTNITPEQIVADLSITFGQTSLREGGVREVQFSVASEDQSERPLNTQELLSLALYRPAPENLLRSLAPEMRYFIYSGDRYSGVFTFESRSYANTFSAMLDWEEHLAESLLPLLHPWASASELGHLIDRKFKDAQVDNIDARLLSDATGNVSLGYAFIDRRTLVLAGSEEALSAILKGTITATSQLTP